MQYSPVFEELRKKMLATDESDASDHGGEVTEYNDQLMQDPTRDRLSGRRTSRKVARIGIDPNMSTLSYRERRSRRSQKFSSTIDEGRSAAAGFFEGEGVLGWFRHSV
ncbi:hypothetical protein AVEN_213426-1 [Araneus ventricosus]|uniref:Uncharacterized protein n=1 Tax=Araneus ventricosus TaxID=182803 RepID=A0A4Y2V8M0_ARAVE|nr:hypothetical protein AVEN_213426-1 [Araneus ventricosus]